MEKIMDLIESHAKKVGGVQNIILGGESQGSLMALGTGLHFKERFNQTIGGIFSLLNVVPTPPETVSKEDKKMLQDTPLLIYNGENDRTYNHHIAEFTYEYFGLKGPMTRVMVGANQDHEYTDKMASTVKNFIYDIIAGTPFASFDNAT